MSSNHYDSESEGEDFNPAPQIDSDDERDIRRRKNDSEEAPSPIHARRDSPPRQSSVSRDNDGDDAVSNNSHGEDGGDRPRKLRDDDDDEEDEEEEEDDEDDMPVRGPLCGNQGGAASGSATELAPLYC